MERDTELHHTVNTKSSHTEVTGRALSETPLDELWHTIRREALHEVQQEPALASMFHAAILSQKTLVGTLAFQVAQRLSGSILDVMTVRALFEEAFQNDADLDRALRSDIRAVYYRDPACSRFHQPLLYSKGFHALESYRVANWFWRQGRHGLALLLQNQISQIFGVDIHPAAKIGQSIMIDHATSVVIGETAVIEDEVSILHEVTLGGTGKESGDRHPKVRHGVLIGAGAKILGNVEIGEGAKIGAGSVVLNDVPPHCTVAGVPARLVGPNKDKTDPAFGMDHRLP